MDNMNSFILYVLILAGTAFTTCTDGDKITISDFDNDKWKEDSIACNGYRQEVSKKLIENKETLVLKESQSIIQFLGTPNATYNDEKTYRYFVEKGVQCLGYTNQSGYDTLETMSIMVDFDAQKKVEDVRLIVP